MRNAATHTNLAFQLASLMLALKYCLTWLVLRPLKELLQSLQSAASAVTKILGRSTLSLIWDRKFLRVVLTSQTFHCGKDWNLLHTLEFGTKRNQSDIEFVPFSQHKSFLQNCLVSACVRKMSQISGASFFHWRVSREVTNCIERLPLCCTQKIHKLPSGAWGQEVRMDVGGLIQCHSIFDGFF